MIDTTFPNTRLRRLRSTHWVRQMVQEMRLHPSDLILPLFVQEGDEPVPIASLPGVSRLPISGVIQQAKEAESLGIPAIALFEVIAPSLKNAQGSEAFNTNNLACRTIQAVKEAVPEIGIIADVALDPYTSHGHDGIVVANDVHNDKTVEALVKQSLVLAQAGADVLAPSDMMDGRIGAIRGALEAENFPNVILLSYAAKYASSLYGPFREAVGSTQAAPVDKRSYQMNPANADEAMREVAMDIAEGADMVMVKPALSYLDIIARISTEYAMPTLAYHVSGEYAMVKLADEAGILEADAVMAEQLLAIKRAGARAILTYAALDVARNL